MNLLGNVKSKLRWFYSIIFNLNKWAKRANWIVQHNPIDRNPFAFDFFLLRNRLTVCMLLTCRREKSWRSTLSVLLNSENCMRTQLCRTMTKRNMFVFAVVCTGNTNWNHIWKFMLTFLLIIFSLSALIKIFFFRKFLLYFLVGFVCEMVRIQVRIKICEWNLFGDSMHWKISKIENSNIDRSTANWSLKLLVKNKLLKVCTAEVFVVIFG